MNTRRLLILLACAGLLTAVTHHLRKHSQLAPRPVAQLLAPAPAVPPIVRSLRPNYPYSVVPGGVYSPAELRIRKDKDPVVRNHYADFNAKDARLVTLSEDRYQYVSYRKRDRIFWTKTALRIPKGEILISDGQNLARTRCGNRLSDKPHPETAVDEPPVADLSLPPYGPDVMRNPAMGFAEPPEEGKAVTLPLPSHLSPNLPANLMEGPGPGPERWPVAGQYPFGSGLPGIPFTPSPAGTKPPQNSTPGSTPPSQLPPGGAPPGTATPAPVPEPGSLALFSAGLLGSGWALLRMRGQRRRSV